MSYRISDKDFGEMMGTLTELSTKLAEAQGKNTRLADENAFLRGLVQERVPVKNAEAPSSAVETRTVWMNYDDVPLSDAIGLMTDEWVDSGLYGAQTVIDLRNAVVDLRAKLAAVQAKE